MARLAAHLKAELEQAGPLSFLSWSAEQYTRLAQAQLNDEVDRAVAGVPPESPLAYSARNAAVFLVATQALTNSSVLTPTTSPGHNLVARALVDAAAQMLRDSLFFDVVRAQARDVLLEAKSPTQSA